MGGSLMSDVRRRDLITLLGGVAAAWPLAARAQQTARIPRIGVLWRAGSEQEEGVYFTSLRQGFSDVGYIEGRTIVLEHTYAAEQYERGPNAIRLYPAQVHRTAR
jgi:putative tryptophan/tyrosine transport system substrate-binding protein